MRKVILSTLITLDGYIDHTAMLADEEMHQYSAETVDQAGAVIFGRVIYQLFESYWPGARTDDSLSPGELEYARAIDRVPKIVYSRTLDRADWKPSTLRREVDSAEIRAMKEEPGGDLVISSGVQLARTFINLGLVDEYHLLVNPVILGRGLHLFKDLHNRLDLHLSGTRTFHSGVVLLEYRTWR